MAPRDDWMGSLADQSGYGFLSDEGEPRVVLAGGVPPFKPPVPSGMNTLEDVLRRTTNKGIVDALPPPPRTHSERIDARTKGMSDSDVLNSDELWAMSRDLMTHRPLSFSQAYSQLAERRLGRPLTADEISKAMVEGAAADVISPRKLYGAAVAGGTMAGLASLAPDEARAEDASPDWRMGSLAGLDAYRGDYPDWARPSHEAEGPPAPRSLPDAGGAQLSAIGNTMRRLGPHLVESFNRTFGAPARIAADNPHPPGSEAWQYVENRKADEGATFAADWALNTLGLGRLGGGVKGGVGVGGGKIIQPQPRAVAALDVPPPAGPALEPMQRQGVVRGRSGRPIETAPLPIGTEPEILERGFAAATGPKAINSFDDIRNLLDQHGTAYVRWSASPKHDMTPGAVSRDYQSGQAHGGLSAQAIDRDFSDDQIFRFLRDYGYLRSKGNEAAVPRLYAGKSVGKDSDFADSIVPSKYLGSLSPNFVRFIDNETNRQRMLLMDQLATGRKALAYYADHPPPAGEILIWTPKTVAETEARLAALGGPVEMPGARPPQPEMQPMARGGQPQPGPVPGSQAWRDMPNPNAPFPQYAEAYPPVGPPKPTPKDKPSFPGETYPAKQYTPEAKVFLKERAKIVKDMEENGYTPYFDPEKRFDVNPENYPLNVDTTHLVPKTLDKIAEHLNRMGATETRQKLQDMYAKGVALGGTGPRPTTQDWYMMGQLEQDLVRQMGPEAGRAGFREKFATPMAATTGGMDPRANLIASGYHNYLVSRGEAWPMEAHQWPVPVGARYGEQLAKTAQRVADEGGFQALGEANPKRHNFAGNFMGHTKPGTMDEQMTMLMQNKGQPDWYGVNERIAAQEAAKVGVDPRKFQETVWHGYKDVEGTPMISEVNAAIERIHRLTGMPRSEIVRRGWGTGDIPIYSIPALMGAGATGMSALASQDRYAQ